MTKTRAEGREFVRILRERAAGFDSSLVRAYILPPFTALEAVGEELEGFPCELGAQNMFWEDFGAYTGEISPPMLIDLGCTIVMLGHSERRSLFGETDENLNKKIHAALRHGLTPMLCIGETAEERDAGATVDVLRRQLSIALRGVTAEMTHRVLLLYEPRWAIGKAQAASLEYVESAHSIVRSEVERLYDKRTSTEITLMYGGSVNLTNLEEILLLAEVDGCGVSRAAWDAASFAEMIRVSERVARIKGQDWKEENRTS